MKSAVIYSSLTGNTKAVAVALLEALPAGTEIYRVNDAPLPDDYELLALGFWVSKSGPDPKTAAYLGKCAGKKLILFGTMAGYPESEYGGRVRANAVAAAKDNEVLGVFLCQGRVSEKMLQNPRHPLTPERLARLAEAARHPNEDDFSAARRAVTEFLRRTHE